MHGFSFIVVGAGVPSRRFCCEMNAGRSRLQRRCRRGEGGRQREVESQPRETERRTKHRGGDDQRGIPALRGRRERRQAGSKPDEQTQRVEGVDAERGRTPVRANDPRVRSCAGSHGVAGRHAERMRGGGGEEIVGQKERPESESWRERRN